MMNKVHKNLRSLVLIVICSCTCDMSSFLYHSRGFSEYSFYPFGPRWGFTPSARYEFIYPPDHDDYDGNYFFPGNSFYYDTFANYPSGDMTGNIDDDGLFVY